MSVWFLNAIRENHTSRLTRITTRKLFLFFHQYDRSPSSKIWITTYQDRSLIGAYPYGTARPLYYSHVPRPSLTYTLLMPCLNACFCGTVCNMYFRKTHAIPVDRHLPIADIDGLRNRRTFFDSIPYFNWM